MKSLFLHILAKIGIIKIKNITKPEDAMKPSQPIYNIKINALNGTPIDLSQFRGKKLLLVNTASECGYTPQYKSLQSLHEKHRDQIEIIGFPANNFGQQEPGSAQEIQSFCERNYGVTFPLSEKISVVGSDQHPLFKWLSSPELNGWNTQKPTWNFCKYLIDENGELIKFFSASIEPLSSEITQHLK